jgi:hypothetical protein
MLIWAPRHEDVLGEWRYSSMHSLAPALDGGTWSVSRPSRFTRRETASRNHWIGGWVGPRAGLETVLKRKIPSPLRDSNPDRPARSQVANTNALIFMPWIGRLKGTSNDLICRLDRVQSQWNKWALRTRRADHVEHCWHLTADSSAAPRAVVKSTKR